MENNDMYNIIEKINYIKKKLSELQDQLKTQTVKGNDTKNQITAVINGLGELIDLQYLDNNTISNKLKYAIIEAVNDGLTKAKDLESKKKREIIGDIDLPNIPGLF